MNTEATDRIAGGVNCTFLQLRRAWEAHHGQCIPSGMPYILLARMLVRKLGFEAAKTLMEGQSNDVNEFKSPYTEHSLT